MNTPLSDFRGEHASKLRALRINPDTRQLAEDGYYVFVIDPSSIPDRIAQLREKQEFSSPTVTSTIADETRHVAQSPEMSRHVEAENPEDLERVGATVADLRKKIEQLEKENRDLDVDTKCRSGDFVSRTNRLGDLPS